MGIQFLRLNTVGFNERRKIERYLFNNSENM